MGKPAFSNDPSYLAMDLNARRRFRRANDPEWRDKQNERVRHTRGSQKYTQLKHRYGIDREDYGRMIERQNNACALCREEFSNNIQVDHCHNTGKIRGLLCRTCNVGLGHFGEDIERLRAAIEYLRKHKWQ